MEDSSKLSKDEIEILKGAYDSSADLTYFFTKSGFSLVFNILTGVNDLRVVATTHIIEFYKDRRCYRKKCSPRISSDIDLVFEGSYTIDGETIQIVTSEGTRIQAQLRNSGTEVIIGEEIFELGQNQEAISTGP